MGHSFSSLPAEERPRFLASNMIHECNNPSTGGEDSLFQARIILIRSALQEGRLEEAVPIISKMIEDMDNALLNIALTGESGAGKSTFINAFRGVGHEDEDAASTGVVETTTNITFYEHPELPNVKLWDLPGIGTLHFKPESYLEQVNFSRYDFFIIISSSRFRVNDAKLAQKIREMGKKFYFVRTKVDIDLNNERRSKPRTFKEENVLQMIRNNCLQHLQKIGIEDPKVFLISSFELESYDFPKLQDELAKELPEHKRRVFFLSLPNITEDIIDQKKASIQKRIWLEALMTGTKASVPFVGVIKEDDIAQLKKRLINYQRKFGVDDASLLKISQASNKPMEEVKALIKSPHLLTVTRDESISERLLKYAEVYFSVNGGLVASGFYFRKSYYTHLHFLETVANDAKILLNLTLLSNAMI
uniref:IRG-type G domain-containing protein n=1 Tax=Vombatus ursinus TaxID=29139 RepID=A0A4X2JSJ7_VOMUR